jgi:hypothetical protein
MDSVSGDSCARDLRHASYFNQLMEGIQHDQLNNVNNSDVAVRRVIDRAPLRCTVASLADKPDCRVDMPREAADQSPREGFNFVPHGLKWPLTASSSPSAHDRRTSLFHPIQPIRGATLGVGFGAF